MGSQRGKWDTSKKAQHIRATSPYGDFDMDGVLNAADCQPFNPYEHGFLGDAWSAVKQRIVTPVYQQVYKPYVAPQVQRVSAGVSAAGATAQRYAQRYKPTVSYEVAAARRRKVKEFVGISARKQQKVMEKERSDVQKLEDQYIREGWIKPLHPSERRPEDIGTITGISTQTGFVTPSPQLPSKFVGSQEYRTQVAKVDRLETGIMPHVKNDVYTSPAVTTLYNKWGGHISGKYFTGSDAEYQRFLREEKTALAAEKTTIDTYNTAIDDLKDLGITRDKRYDALTKEYTEYETAQKEYERLHGLSVMGKFERKEAEWAEPFKPYTSFIKESIAYAETPEIKAETERTYAGYRRLFGLPSKPFDIEKRIARIESEYKMGIVEGVAEKPLKTFVTTAAFIALPPALKGVGAIAKGAGAAWSAKGLATALPRVTRTGAWVSKRTPRAVGVGLGGAYAAGTGYRIYETPPELRVREFGKITGTELLPMGVGAYAGTKVLAMRLPVSRIHGLEPTPTGHIGYTGIAYKGKPLIGSYKETILAGYKPKIKIQKPFSIEVQTGYKARIPRPFTVETRFPSLYRPIIKEATLMPFKIRGKVHLERPLEIKGFKFRVQKPIKTILTGEYFKLGEPFKFKPIKGYKWQNIIKEYKIGKIAVHAPLTLKGFGIKFQTPKIKLQNPFRIQKYRLGVTTHPLLKTIMAPTFKTGKKGFLIGKGADVGVPIMVGETAIKIPITGHKLHGWTAEDVLGIEKYIATRRGVGGAGRAERLQAIELARARMLAEPYETIFTSGITPSEIISGVVPTPTRLPAGIKIKRPTFLPPEMMTSGIPKGETIRFGAKEAPFHEVRLESGIVGQPRRFQLLLEQMVSGIPKGEAIRFGSIKIHGKPKPRFEVRMETGFVHEPPRVRFGLMEEQMASGIPKSDAIRFSKKTQKLDELELSAKDVLRELLYPDIYGKTPPTPAPFGKSPYVKSILRIPEEAPLRIRSTKPKPREKLDAQDPIAKELIERITKPHLFKEVQTKHLLKSVEEPKIGVSSITENVLRITEDLPLQIRATRPKLREKLGEPPVKDIMRELKFPQIYGETPTIFRVEKPMRVGMGDVLRIKYTEGVGVHFGDIAGVRPPIKPKPVSIKKRVSFAEKWRKEEAGILKDIEKGLVTAKEEKGLITLQKVVTKPEIKIKTVEMPKIKHDIKPRLGYERKRYDKSYDTMTELHDAIAEQHTSGMKEILKGTPLQQLFKTVKRKGDVHYGLGVVPSAISPDKFQGYQYLKGSGEEARKMRKVWVGLVPEVAIKESEGVIAREITQEREVVKTASLAGLKLAFTPFVGLKPIVDERYIVAEGHKPILRTVQKQKEIIRPIQRQILGFPPFIPVEVIPIVPPFKEEDKKKQRKKKKIKRKEREWYERHFIPDIAQLMRTPEGTKIMQPEMPPLPEIHVPKL